MADGDIEIWRAIPDWPYEASNLGRVRRSVTGYGTYAGRVLQSALNGRGYLMVMLSKGGVPRPFTVHKCVALAFLGPKPTTRHQVNHIDGQRTNNRVGNLEWVTSSEDRLNAWSRNAYANREESRGERNHAAKLTAEDVLAIREARRRGVRISELASKYNVRTNTISWAASGRKWGHLPGAIPSGSIRVRPSDG